MNTGDTAWVLISTVLVFAMTIPGLAFFYGGLVRRKNVLSILMQCFIVMCVISLQWVLFGYSLSFGPDTGAGIIGGLQWAGLKSVGGQPNGDYAATIPHLVFMIFQAMFAVITPALIIGAFAERMKFSAFLVFTLLWTTLVYDPLAHWVWGTGGWMRNLGGWTLPEESSFMSVPVFPPWSCVCFWAGASTIGVSLPATQPAVYRSGRGPPVVRMVRVQRRQCLGGE